MPAYDDDGVIAPGALATMRTQGLAQASAAALVERESVDAMVLHNIAHRYPRSVVQARAAIQNAFSRQRLAEVAQYEYAKGGTEVKGPSIRAAEAIAQYWGNVGSGYHITNEFLGSDGVPVSEVRCFAVDYEGTNRAEAAFRVRHWRQTKRGGYVLTDDRDVYELVANMAARRRRACILAVIPSDVVEDAMEQAEVTLKAKADTSVDGMKKMLDAFAPYGVTREMIEARIQRNLDSISPAQVVTLKRIWVSLRDGMSRAGQWFDAPAGDEGAGAAGASLAAVKDALAAGAGTNPTPEPPKPPQTAPSRPAPDGPREAPQGPRPAAVVLSEELPWEDAPDASVWLARVKAAQSFDELQDLSELIRANFTEGPDRDMLTEALAHRDGQIGTEQDGAQAP